MKAIERVKELMTALQSGDIELAATLLHDDFHIDGLAPRQLSTRGFLALQSALLAAMPDFSYNLSNIQQEGETVRATVNMTGTHTQELSLPTFGLPSIPATGLSVILSQVPATFQLENDLVKSIEIAQEPGGGLSGLLQQVGAELPVLPRERTFPA